MLCCLVYLRTSLQSYNACKTVRHEWSLVFAGQTTSRLCWMICTGSESRNESSLRCFCSFSSVSTTLVLIILAPSSIFISQGGSFVRPMAYYCCDQGVGWLILETGLFLALLQNFGISSHVLYGKVAASRPSRKTLKPTSLVVTCIRFYSISKGIKLSK